MRCLAEQNVFFVLWSGTSGGLQRYAECLAMYIHEHHPRITPHVLFLTTGGPSGERLQQAGVRVTEAHFSSGHDVVAICRLVGFLRKQQAHVIHVHGATPYATALFAYAMPQARVIHTVHYSRFNGDLFRRALERHNFRKASFVTFVSPGQRDLYGKLLGVDTASSPVIPFGFGFSASQRSGAPIQSPRLGRDFEETDLVVGYVGYFVRFKGVHKLIQAVARVAAQIPRIRLMIIGYGPEETSLRAEAERLGVANITRFYIDPTNIGELQQCMDIVVHPSEHESLCLSVLEAMAMGKVVVVNDFESSSFIVQDGSDGIVLPQLTASSLATTLTRLARSPDLCIQMGRRASKAVRSKFDREAVFHRYLHLYGVDEGVP